MQDKRFNCKVKDIAKHFGVDEYTVKKWVDTQMLKYKKHYIDVRSPGGKNAMLRFNLSACQQFFETEPEKR